jgi:hypothetical protein
MPNTDTLENVITAVHQQSINHFDEIVPLREMEFDSLTQYVGVRQAGGSGSHGSAAIVQPPAGTVLVPVPLPC